MEVDSTECDKRLDFLQIDSLIVRLAYLNQVALHASKAASSAVVITGRRDRCRACRCVIYASDTTNPVYANIIAAELVWQQARSHASLKPSTSIGDAFDVAKRRFSLGKIYPRYRIPTCVAARCLGK